MKLGLIAIVGAFLLSACGNAQQSANALNPATGWANWNKTSAAVYTGPSRIVSDPSVLPDESLFRMAYTSVDFANVNGPHASISLATSGDSLSWGAAANTTGTTFRGEVLRGRPGQWDENLETPFLLKTQSGYLLYYSGYRDGVQPGTPGKGFPASLGVARSVDGVNFTRVQSDPILSPTPASFDSDAIYSPDIIPYQGGYLMVYAGHCYVNCPGAPGVRVLGATSPDGIHWSKLADPLLSAAPTPDWMHDGVAEPAIIMAPDGDLYLFFTGVKDQQHVIGIARASSANAAWSIDPDPIVAPTTGGFDEAGDVGPTVVLENGVVRMWFSGSNHQGQYSIGYAEAPWPLRQDSKSSHTSHPVFALANTDGHGQ